MAVTYDSVVKNARMEATRGAVANGTLEICTTAYGTVLAVIGLDATAGSVSGDTWTLGFDAQPVTAAAAGTAAVARIKDASSNIRVSGLTVGGASSGQDIELSNTNIASGQDVTITSGAIQHAT